MHGDQQIRNQIIKTKIIKENEEFIEQFVINWRLEYQPLLNKVNNANEFK